MLRIHIGSITHQGLDMDEKVDAAFLPLLDEITRKAALRFTRPIHVRIHGTLAGETIPIDGTVETQVCIPCSRCLVPFELDIETAFFATAVPEFSSNEILF